MDPRSAVTHMIAGLLSATLCGCFVDEGQMSSETGTTTSQTTTDGESDTTSPCPLGSQGCSCVANSCLDGLVCDLGICILPVCGNGVQEGVERCDDGDNQNGNGCNNDCEISGTLQWQMFVNGPGEDNDFGADIVIDSAQNVHVNGILIDKGGVPARWHASLRPDKTLLETGHGNLPNELITELNGLALAGDDLIDIGTKATSTLGDNIWFRRRSGSEELWVRGIDATGEEDVGLDVAVDSAGNIVGVGYETTEFGQDVAIVKLDPEGTVLWHETTHSSGTLNDTGHAVAIAAGDDIVVGGSIGFATGNSNAWVARYNPDGELQWQRTFSGAAGFDDAIEAVAVDAADNIIVGGFFSTDGMLGAMLLLARLTPDGVPDWETEQATPGAATDLALDSTGAIAMTGVVYSEEQGLDMLIHKYTNTGELMWADIRNSFDAAWDAARGVAIDDEDSIYVIGSMSVLDPINVADIWIAKYNP